MSHYVTVVVYDRNTNRGKTGVSVSSNESGNIRTDDNGQVSLSFSGSRAQIYVDGAKIYDDFVSKCPSTLTYSV